MIRTIQISPYIYAQGEAVTADPDMPADRPDMHGRISVNAGGRIVSGFPILKESKND